MNSDLTNQNISKPLRVQLSTADKADDDMSQDSKIQRRK